MNRMKKRWLPVAAVVLTVAVLCWFFGAMSQLQTGYDQEGRQQLENALRKAAAACYAVEGIYPPTLEYLKTHYGIQINEERYAVFYEIFADNLMPEITVLERKS